LCATIRPSLCRATEIVAQLAHRLATGNHIHTYAQLNVNQMDKQTKLSERGRLDSMSAKHLALRCVQVQINEYYRLLTGNWQRSLNPRKKM